MMSEESISASPVVQSKLERTIGLHIKKRRRKLNLKKSNSHSQKTSSFNETETSSLETSTAKQLDITALYYDEEPDVLVKVYNQTLENERLLIKADQILPTRTKCIDPKYITKSFKNMGEISASQYEEQHDIDQLTNSPIVTSNIIPIINTEFQITETELLRACDEAEHIENQNAKSIVQEILDDFSTVGSTPSPEKKKYSVDDTPRFQFKNKTMRTYSRKNNFLNSCINQNVSSNKNLSILEKFNESTTALKCNNDVYGHTHDADSVRNKSDLPNVNTNIFEKTPVNIIVSPLKPNMREIYKFVLNRNAFDEDFHGFEDSEVYIFRKNDLCKDTGNAIKRSKQFQPQIITQVYIDSILSDANKMLEEVNNLGIQKTGSHDGDDVKCDLKQDGIGSLPISLIEKMSPTTSPLPKDNSSLHSLLFDCDDWDDTDFDHVCAVGESEEPSKTNELFNVSDVDWNEEFPYKSQGFSQNMNNSIVLKDCDNLKTANNKAAFSSKMAKKKAEELLKEFTGNTNETILEIPKENGFKTASNKTMNISESARLKAQQFILDFNNSQTMSCKNLKPNVPTLPSLENEKNTEPKISEFENNVGASFTTASKKPISISEEAINIANRLVIEVDADSSSLEIAKTIIRKRKCIEISNEPPHTNLEKISKLNSLSGLKTNTSPRTPFSPIVNGSPNISSLLKFNSTPLSRQQFADRRPLILSRRNHLSMSKRKLKTLVSTEITMDSAPTCATINGSPDLVNMFSAVSTSTPRNVNGRNSSIVEETSCQKIAIDQFNMISDKEKERIQLVDSPINKLNTNSTPSSNVRSTIDLSPSPRIRRERLKMYGRPPALSPILMSSSKSCRAPGLNRKRTLGKNT